MANRRALPNQEPTRQRVLPPLVLALWPFLLFAPLTLVLRVFSAYDVQGYFFPYHVLPAKMLADGQLPLWNPYVFSGIPLLGDGQTAMFYPPNWLFFLLPAQAALNYAILIEFSIAGLSMYLFARSLDLWRLPAFMAAIAYMFCGFMTARVVHLSIMSEVALIPLILFCVDRLLMSQAGSADPGNLENGPEPAHQRPLAARWLALSGLAIGAQALAGHPQVPVYTVLGVFLLAIVRGVEQALARRAWRPLIVAPVLAAGAYLLGGIVAAVQLVPWAEAARLSTRAAGADYAWVFSTSTTGAEWLMFLFPYLLGAHPDSPFAIGTWSIFAASRAWEHSAYVGMLPLALALVAIGHFIGLTRRTSTSASTPGASSVASLRSRWYALLFLILLLALGVLLAAGSNTPFSHIMYRVPVLGSLRAVERGLVLAAVALTLLAGFGLQRIVEAERSRPQPWLLLPAALIVLVPAFFMWAAHEYPWRLRQLFAINPYDVMKLSLAWPGAYVPLLLAAATALLLAWWSGRRASTLTLGIGVALVMIDLGVYALAFNVTTGPGFYDYRPESARVLKSDGELFRKATFLTDLDDAVDRVGQDLLVMSWGMVYGVEDINGFNSLQPRRYTDYIFGPRTGDVSYGFLRDDTLLRADSPILSSLNVRYVYVPAHLRITQGPHLRQIFENQHVRILENTEVYPRAYFVDRVSSEQSPRSVLRQVTELGFDGRRNALVEGVEPPSVQPPSSAPAQAHASSPSPTELRVTTDTAERRFLVVSEMYFPGWRAYVDDVETPIFRTNYLFRGVVVPAGQHVVRFVYRPTSVLTGSALSALALIGIVLLLYRGVRAPHPRTVRTFATPTP